MDQCFLIDNVLMQARQALFLEQQEEEFWIASEHYKRIAILLTDIQLRVTPSQRQVIELYAKGLMERAQNLLQVVGVAGYSGSENAYERHKPSNGLFQSHILAENDNQQHLYEKFSLLLLSMQRAVRLTDKLRMHNAVWRFRADDESEEAASCKIRLFEALEQAFIRFIAVRKFDPEFSSVAQMRRLRVELAALYRERCKGLLTINREALLQIPRASGAQQSQQLKRKAEDLASVELFLRTQRTLKNVQEFLQYVKSNEEALKQQQLNIHPDSTYLSEKEFIFLFLRNFLLNFLLQECQLKMRFYIRQTGTQDNV